MKVTQEIALKKIANRIRYDVLQEVFYGKSGHIGGAFSCAEILTVLYFNEMNIDPTKPQDALRDRFVLSKGHASAAMYATLAERGYFPKEELLTFRKISSNLQGHPDMHKIPGIDMTSGSLGQGLSVANGMAMASKMDKSGYRVYCLLGDGELEEGQVWEACMTAVKYKLDNLCAIVDCNGLQLTDTTDNVKSLKFEDIEQKFSSFGFNTIVINGHDINEIMDAFSKAEEKKDMPTVIIARTIKGKGVSFMENKVEWHGKTLSEENFKLAVEELTKTMSEETDEFFAAKIEK